MPWTRSSSSRARARGSGRSSRSSSRRRGRRSSSRRAARRSSTRSPRRSARSALAVVTDVTKQSDVEHLAKAAIERFGRIDVWVNNAGRGISRSVADLTDEDLDAMWTVNMKSVVYGIQAVLPHFKSRNAGQIVNVSSGLSRAPLAPVRAAYGAVKSAVNMLTASLRVELKATHPGIHVTLLLPGVVATEFGVNSLGRRHRGQPQAPRRAAGRRRRQGHRRRHREPQAGGVYEPVHRRRRRPVPARAGGRRGGDRVAAALASRRRRARRCVPVPLLIMVAPPHDVLPRPDARDS